MPGVVGFFIIYTVHPWGSFDRFKGVFFEGEFRGSAFCLFRDVKSKIVEALFFLV